MSDSNSVLKCPLCQKEYPQDSVNCSDDGSELIPAFSGADPFIGKLFAEKYDILSLLGEGGMSKVYKARHKLMKRMVAVKLLHESATKDPLAKARFQQEAEAASALNHQNVVTVHDFGFTPNCQAFFVMDCLEGKTLEEILEEEPPKLLLVQAIEIFSQACDGLEHAHRKGIIHRDIKPSNLVIIKQEDGSDLVKIVDFGIAKVLTPPVEGEKQRQLTQTGEVFGTPAYMSPEQCRGEPLDGRSDLYSFGCLMYEALSGQPPLLGETFINTIVKHINERPKSFSETAQRVKVPVHIEAVVMKCLEKDPKNRYASAAELKQALYDAAFVDGVKGMRFGAVPEPKYGSTTVPHSQAHSASLSEQKVTRRWRLSFTFTWVALAIVMASLASWIFLYPGPDGDKGTLFTKMMWQHHLSESDELVRQKKYYAAVKELKLAQALAENFSDGYSRLDITLNKLVEVCGYARDYATQETVNKQISQLVINKAYKEYEELMSFFKQWEAPSLSDSRNQELSLQAAAMAQRILFCADKLSLHSREKTELLLKKAIKVFDSLEAKDWKSGVRFRISLAECYHGQQRFGEERIILGQAVASCPDKPLSAEGWRAKIQVQMLLGQLERNVSMNWAQLDQARATLETALSWVRSQLPSDKELLKESLNSMVIMDRLYHTKQYDDKASVFEKEAKALEDKDDSRSE